MSKHESVLAIERWQFIIAEIIRINVEKSLGNLPMIAKDLWAAEGNLNDRYENEVTFLRQEVWPLFIYDEIQKHGRLLRNDNPWLEDFTTFTYGYYKDFLKLLNNSSMILLA